MSDIEDDSILDQQDATLTANVETPNIFRYNLLRRLGLAQGSEAEATGSSLKISVGAFIVVLLP